MQRTVIILACFFIYLDCFSQSTGFSGYSKSHREYSFVHYTPKDGLVNSRVRKAYQDTKGRMYFLTYGGLSVYDGIRFRNYTTQNGLASDMINDILQVGNDSFLIAPNVGVINTLVNGKIGRLKTANNYSPLINQFLRTEDGNIYASSDDGLFLLKGNVIEKLPLPPFLSQTDPGPFLGSIAEHKNFLVFSRNDLRNYAGLFVYDKIRKKLTDLSDTAIYFIGKDNSNHIWVSLSNRLCILDNNKLDSGKIKFIPLVNRYKNAEHFPSSAIGFDKKNTWLALHNQIVCFTSEGTQLNMPLPVQEITSYVKNIFIDRENSVWISHEGGGVFKMVGPHRQMSKIPLEKNNALHFFYVYSKNDTSWLSSTENKILRKTTASAILFNCNLKIAPFIIGQAGNKLLAYDNSALYEAIIPTDRTNFIEFKKKFSLPDTNTFARAIIDPFGNIIATTKTGISVLKDYKPVFINPYHVYEYADAIEFDTSGRVWFALRGSGVMAFTLQPTRPSQYLRLFTQMKRDSADPSPRSMVIDKKGIIWLGTREHGLIAFKANGNQLKRIFHFQTSNGLTDNFVTSLSCDESNNVIAGTQTGLDRIIPDDSGNYRIENLSKSNNVFAFIKYVWIDNGKVNALSNDGAILEAPAFEKSQPGFLPQLMIEELRLNGHPVPVTKHTLKYDENNLSFSVAAPSFIDEKQIQFSNFLEGAENATWSDTSSTNSTINLIGLPPGTYKLHIKAFFPSTPYPAQELIQSFIIQPPWWRTWWFRSAAVVFFIALLIAAFRFYYRRKLEKEMAALEKQQAIEKERTRIAADIHDDLGAGLTKIKYLSEHILEKTDSGEIVKPELEKLKTFSSELVESMGEIIWAVGEKNNLLSNTLYYLRSYAVNYCEENDIECSFEIPENFTDRIVSGNIRRNIFLLLKESLHNIVKHAGAKKVTIQSKVNENLELIIKDDGKGFSENGNIINGNGLINMRKRVKELQGVIEFANRNGTMVIIQLPLTTNQSTIG